MQQCSITWINNYNIITVARESNNITYAQHWLYNTAKKFFVLAEVEKMRQSAMETDRVNKL